MPPDFTVDFHVGNETARFTGSVTFDSGHRVITGHQPDGFTVPPDETWMIAGLVTTPANVVVLGRLIAHPDGAVLRFVDVDEDAMVGGGGHEVIESDVGLWVMGAGQLDLHASNPPQVAWGRGEEAPTEGTLVTAPDDPSLRGRTIDPPLPEVLRLDRPVRIEGEPGHHAHLLINSSSPQFMTGVQIRNMGPPAKLAAVTGRYALHFHHCEDGSRGSVLDRVVVWGSGNHAFVPHASHGISFIDCIGYNITGDGLWWDNCRPHTGGLANAANDLLLDHCVIGEVHPAENRRGGKKGRTSGMWLGCGEKGIIRDCSVFSVYGSSGGSAYRWPEPGANEQVWAFIDNVAHHAPRGINIWHNSSTDHLIENTDIYSCRTGVDNGAYGNAYRFKNIRLIGNDVAVIQHANWAGGAEGWTCVYERDSTSSLFIDIQHAPVGDNGFKQVPFEADYQGGFDPPPHGVSVEDRIKVTDINYAATCV